MQEERHTVVVIGSGFGGTMTSLALARALKQSNKPGDVLILERGTWWTTPVGTVQDKEVAAYDFLREKGQPVQFWSSLNHFRGFLDIFTRCLRKPWNIDGLYQLDTLGRKAWLGLFGGQNDGVTVVRASGVGGGSLVYSNITIRPPELIFADARWNPVTWTTAERDAYYNLARQAIGVGVVYALNERAAQGRDPNFPGPISGKVTAYAPNASVTLDVAGTATTYSVTAATVVPPTLRVNDPVWLRLGPTGEAARIDAQGPFKVNTGLSNIVSRSAAVPTVAREALPVGSSFNPRGIRQIVPQPIKAQNAPKPPAPFGPDDDPTDALWIDRARVFQNAMSDMTGDYGLVDLAINDLPQEPTLLHVAGNPKNYCERQGRCNVGCLPGARHTLNKQLMVAAVGKPNPGAAASDPQFKDILSIRALCEVDYIEALASGGYRIHYTQHEPDDSPRGGGSARKTVLADQVILAAGCLGTNELLLRSKARTDGLPDLSDRTGYGFSTNGDYIAFLEGIDQRVTLTRGPVTTSFAHLNGSDTGEKLDQSRFHTIEDQGVPPALASIVGAGVPLIRSLGKGGHRSRWFVLWAMLCWGINRLFQYVCAFFKNSRKRQEFFESPEEQTGKIMCVVAQGRESAIGQFRLGTDARDTSVRVTRNDGRPFYADPVYADIEQSLDRLRDRLISTAGPRPKFINPFLMNAAGAFDATSVPSPHPLGGCRIASDVNEGVVDQYGRVFKKTAGDPKAVYPGLYVADASIVPTALGVNPSLTITALSLRIADQMMRELGLNTK